LLLSGQNYDSTFKSLADDDPRGLLFLFSGIPLTADVVIEPLPREVTAPALQVDHIYRIKTADRQWIWHIEVQTHYKSDLPERILQYDLLLAVKYPGEEIRSTLVLLVERTTPRSVQAEIEADLGGLRVRAEFQVIRMWELDPKPVIESGRPDLLPWVGLMQSSPAEFLTALHRVGMSGDPKLRAQTVLLGGLRYDKQGIEAVLRRIGDMFITADILRESSVTKDFIRELEENAIASGTARGRVEEARRLIRTLVALRFPSLGDLPQLDRVADAGRLEELMRELILADSLEPAAAAVARIPA
jgi:predicted transposase YdaD